VQRVTDPGAPFGRADLDRAVADGDIPTLLMVLFQLTGDEKWLTAPYRPTPARGLSDHPTGGLSEAHQADVRAAAVTAILRWSEGEPSAVPAPSGDLIDRMMSTCVGEPVPSEYGLLLAQEMAADQADPAPVPDQPGRADFTVAIIGAGVSGMLAGIRLRQHGIRFVIFEKSDGVGGTWLQNRYPGAGVDTPSFLYSFSFFPRNWTSHFGKRDEILHYLQDLADTFDLKRYVEFQTEVVEAEYLTAQQDWAVTVVSAHRGRRTERFNAVISAVGLLSVPAVPSLPGTETFRGQLFHSADWPDDLDLDGRDVAVIGTGASAMQIVPAIAPSVASLTVFQRSPQWVAPNSNYFAPVPPALTWLMEHVPFYHRWYRFRLAWVFNDRIHGSLQIDPDWPDPARSLNAVNDRHRQFFIRQIRGELAGRPDLQAKAIPDYPPFGKRMLLDNGWYAALRRDNVELVAEPAVALSADGVRSSSGADYPADVVVLATGFDALNLLHPIVVRGRDRRTLREVWGPDDATAYLGITTPDFPNLFLMYGPNTNSGSGGSYIFIAECQIAYIVDLIVKMLDSGIAVVEPRQDVHDEYNRRVDQAHARMVWAHPGMRTYYRNARGRVVTNSPWRFIDYWQMTRQADLADFVTEQARPD
jgi:4-hydroxyacetophenone monooxygenase